MIPFATTATVELSGTTIMEKGFSALQEIEHRAEFLGKDEDHALWLRIAGNAGIEIHRFGDHYTAAAGVFGGDFLHVFGAGGSEIFELGQEIALDKISSLIRRAIAHGRR